MKSPVQFKQIGKSGVIQIFFRNRLVCTFWKVDHVVSMDFMKNLSRYGLMTKQQGQKYFGPTVWLN